MFALDLPAHPLVLSLTAVYRHSRQGV